MNDTEHISKTKEIIHSQIQKFIETIKSYINCYSLIPVLEKAFINDNFKYIKDDGTANDDCKLCLYIGDLYLTYQKDKELELPTKEQVEEIFNCFLELVHLSMTEEILINDTSLSSIDYKVQFKYTERSFFISIMIKICEYIIDDKFLELFYSKTGFYLYDIFTFNYIYKGLLFDRYEKNQNNLFSITFDELFIAFQSLDNNITRQRFQKLIEYFTSENSNNPNYLLSVNNPLIHKPIIRSDNQIICCDSLILVKNCFYILEDFLKKDNKIYTEYGCSKGKRFEKTVQTIFQNLFPGSTFYSSLKYVTEDKTLHETDLIIDTGDYLLFVESKGRSFQENAKKGNDGSYKRSIENLIKKAHEQCKTAYMYLSSMNSVVFNTKDEEYTFSKKRYLDIYLITIELDNLDVITSDIYKTLEVFEPNPIITFSLYDLLIIQDILERGSLFLHYLDQRRGITKQRKTITSSELDYLSYFIHTGAFFDKQNEIIKEDFTLLSITGFSDEIEKYYFGELLEKPHFPLVTGELHFLQQLNQCNAKLGFTIEKVFITANLETKNKILSTIEALKQQAQIRERSSIGSFILETNTMGLSIICYNDSNMIPNSNYFRNYIHEQQAKWLIQNWFFVVYSLSPYGIHTIIFER